MNESLLPLQLLSRKSGKLRPCGRLHKGMLILSPECEYTLHDKSALHHD